METNNKWVVFLFTLPFLNIYVLKNNFSMIMWISCFVFTLLTLMWITKSKYIYKFDVYIFLFAFVTWFSVLINGTASVGVIYSISSLLGVCLFINKSMNNFKELIKGLYYLFSIIVSINFVSIILYPEGLSGSLSNNPIFFLGAKNTIQITIVPSISIILLYTYYLYGKIKLFPFIQLIICILSLYLSGSGTSLVIMGLATLFLSLYKLYSFSFRAYLSLYIMLFISIVIYRVQDFLFGNIIINYLHKDLSFTGRTYIWDIALENIKNSWLFGYGRGNDIIYSNTSNSFFYNPTDETHNGVLEVLMNSGLVGLTVIIFILTTIGNRLDNYKNSVIARVLSFSIVSFLIMGLVESVFYKIEFWIILVISYNVNKIIDKKNKEELKLDEAN